MALLDRLLPAPRAETTTLRSPATWFLEALGMQKASSGIRVSEATAMRLSAYYCGVNMISGTIGSLPLNAYKRDGKKRDIAERHPVHWLLHHQPNPEMTAMSLRRSWVVHALGRGNAYGEIQWNGRGEPAAIWPLLPHITRPERDDEGELWYRVTLPETGEPRFLRSWQVIHVPGMGYDGIMGYGLIQVACEAIGLNAAQDQYAGKFFANGGNISGVIETDKVLTDKQFTKLKSEVAQKMSGLTNAHRIQILEAGLKWKAINPTHQEAQLVEERRFTVEEWARWLNMPPHKLKEMTHATFSNIEHQNIEWMVDTIGPWLKAFEQEFNRKLFTKQSVFYTKHVVEGQLRGDIKTRFEAYAIARQWGWMSADDILELEDRNPLPGKQGEIYLIPANMMRADQAGQQTPAERTAERMARVAAERVVRLEERSKASGPDFHAKVCEWLGVKPETARHYAALAAQLNLLADEAGIDADQVRARKCDLLVKLVMEEAHG